MAVWLIRLRSYDSVHSIIFYAVVHPTDALSPATCQGFDRGSKVKPLIFTTHYYFLIQFFYSVNNTLDPWPPDHHRFSRTIDIFIQTFVPLRRLSSQKIVYNIVTYSILKSLWVREMRSLDCWRLSGLFEYRDTDSVQILLRPFADHTNRLWDLDLVDFRSTGYSCVL